MFGIESLLVQLFGEDSLLIMLAGFFLLVILNLFTKLYIEFKKKDLNWDDLPTFIQPLVLYTAFLVGLELLVATGKGFPVIYELFQGLQIIGYVSVMGKYFKKFYSNLKELGMETDEKFDQHFEEKVQGIEDYTRENISDIVAEYMASKQEKAQKKEEV